MFENPFLHPWWGYWKRVSTAILTYVWKSWVPEEHRWGESKEDQLAILTHVWNMGETAHRWGESKENQLAILTHVYIHGCWKVSNFTHVYRCTDMTLGLTSLDAEKCPTSAVFNNALTWLWDWPAKDPLLSHVVLNGIPQPLGHNSAISWPILDLIGTNEHPRIPLCPMWFSMESCNLLTITQPFLDQF